MNKTLPILQEEAKSFHLVSLWIDVSFQFQFPVANTLVQNTIRIKLENVPRHNPARPVRVTPRQTRGPVRP